MTIDPTNDTPETVALAHLIKGGPLPSSSVEATDVLERIHGVLLAYRSALVGETDESLVEAAAKAMAEEREYDWATLADLYGVPTHLGKDGLRRMARAALAPLLVQLQDKEARIKALETALRPFADLAGSSEGFCSPVAVSEERMWCNNHRAAYDEGECGVVKADKVLRGAR